MLTATGTYKVKVEVNTQGEKHDAKGVSELGEPRTVYHTV